MNREKQYLQASTHAAQKKVAFLSSAAATKARLSPARLKQDVKHKAVEGLLNGSSHAVAKVNEHPVAVAAGGGALLLYLFRRPLSALFGRMYVRITNRTPETSETDDG